MPSHAAQNPAEQFPDWHCAFLVQAPPISTGPTPIGVLKRRLACRRFARRQRRKQRRRVPGRGSRRHRRRQFAASAATSRPISPRPASSAATPPRSDPARSPRRVSLAPNLLVRRSNRLSSTGGLPILKARSPSPTRRTARPSRPARSGPGPALLSDVPCQWLVSGLTSNPGPVGHRLAIAGRFHGSLPRIRVRQSTCRSPIGRTLRTELSRGWLGALPGPGQCRPSGR